MKPFYFLLIAVLVFSACNENGKKESRYLPNSVGSINSLQIVASNELWNGNVGETIRNHFAAPADGLPQDEPLYSISQLSPEAFTGFARNSRLFIHVTIGEEDKVQLGTDVFAKPQSGAIITATTQERLAKLIDQNAPKILENFLKSELREKQRRISKSLKNLDSLKKTMGLSMKVPTAYRTAKATDSFFWLRKDLKSGTTNILIYEVPLNMISKDSADIGEIIKVRDSIGSKYLPVEDDEKFITEAAYAPFLFKTEIDGKFAWETKGTWEVKNVLMAGPFVNFAVRDEANDRYLILEGFTYAPSVKKRDLQFELEAILRTAVIK